MHVCVEGAKLSQNKFKMGSFHLSVHPQWSKITVGKTHFWPIFDPILFSKRPLFKAFEYFPSAKTRHHDLQRGQKHSFEYPKWSRNIFGKKDFFSPGTLVDPPGAPTVRGPRCPPAPPSAHLYGGLVGPFLGLETTKSGGLRVDWVPSECVFEPRSPRSGPFLVLGLLDKNSAHSGHF